MAKIRAKTKMVAIASITISSIDLKMGIPKKTRKIETKLPLFLIKTFKKTLSNLLSAKLANKKEFHFTL